MQHPLRWQRQRALDGSLEIVCANGVRISIRERVRPVMSLQAICGGASTETIVTTEGELADLATIERAGAPVSVAIIAGDDFQTIVEGRGPHELARSSVRDLATHFPLGLGAKRVRPVRHRGPSGWTHSKDGLISIWRSQDDSCLKVYPARPLDEPAATHALAIWLHDDLFDGLTLDHIEHVPLLLGAVRGTLGRATVRDVRGEPRVVVTAGLSDSAYRYVVRLDQPVTMASDDALFDVLATCTWFASASASYATRAVGHWAE
jgi:hypothetical protein